MNFREKLGKELIFFDGAFGTMLQQRGLGAGEIPETWNITHPDVILQIHREYLEAGCDVISANTFGANALKLEGTCYTVEQVISEGVALAKKAVAQSGRDALVALDIGSLGKLMKPIGELGFDEAYDYFKQVIVAGTKSGADIILIETVNDPYEMKAMVLAAKENSTLPLICCMIFDENGRLLTGGDIPCAVALLEGLGVDAIGFNCGLGPKQMLELLPQLVECSSLPILINSNAGLPVVKNGQTVFEVGAQEFAADVKRLVLGGVHMVGGCCGTTPAHIKALVELCKGVPPCEVVKKSHTVVSSYTQAVRFGERPLIIGERVNPTGKPRLKQALRDGDLEYIYKEGITQQDNGAHILDVNVGLPEIDEVQMMENVICGLQGLISLPLQIDTSNIAAMERAMRIYNGKPMINSVNGKRESMEAVFPLVKKYGGVVVCLTLDEDGIPDTAEGRVRIAEKIIATAAEYGIDKKDLVVDTLVMTISTGDRNAQVTLEAMRRVRALGVHTVLGVSNISFGLPERERITTTFFTMAMDNGLSAGIVNPSSDMLMSAYYSYCALSANDPQCLNYIGKYSGDSGAPIASVKKTDEDISLYDAITKGMAESAAKATERLLLGEKTPLEIINNMLIPALDEVGKGFEEQRLFLPQLLMSADAAKAAFDVIKSTLQKQGERSDSKGKIIIATVKGDIHDIGKNIVKVLLENYGFEVIDLGKDVPPELIVERALGEKVKLVALSALMTTTVVYMEETIKQLRAGGVDCRVMVGGAVLTQEYADMIGADFYSKDAMGSVRYANELAEKGLI